MTNRGTVPSGVSHPAPRLQLGAFLVERLRDFLGEVFEALRRESTLSDEGHPVDAGFLLDGFWAGG